MLEQFLSIAKDAKEAGGRVFNEWTSNPDKFLKHESALPVDEILRSLTVDERKKFLILFDYFSGMSLYFLFKKLEEGESGFSFSLKMTNDNTGETYDLIDEKTDNDIRSSFL